MVENRRLGGSGGAGVVMGGDRVEELRPRPGVQSSRPRLDQAQSEVDVPEQPALVRGTEHGPRPQLERPAEVVEDRRRNEEIAAEARVQLRRLAADRRDRHRVLEQSTRVGVMELEARRERAQAGAKLWIPYELPHRGAQARVRDLAGEEVEETVELVRVAAHCRRQSLGIRGGSGLERPDLELEAIAEALHPPEHPDRVSLAEAPVEEIDVVPHAGFDATARVDELESEVGRTAARAELLLPCDRVDALDDPILRELGNRPHEASLGPATAGSVAAVAEVAPFRAVRYDEATAGPLDALVAPPYDVISPEQRVSYLARSPYNVVHLTLPDDERDSARLWADWLAGGVLVRDDTPTVWALSQDYVGPDGVQRTRNGLVASLRVEPYERRVVLPHERTHRGPKEGRLRLLRAVRAQLEPILLLHDGPPVKLPGRAPDLEVEGARLWRVDDGVLDGFEERQLLIADGHHRYETALAFHEENGTETTAWLMVVFVSTRDEGLTIFPTHRLAERLGAPLDLRAEDPRALLRDAGSNGDEQGRVVVYRAGGAAVVEGDGLDVEVVETLGPEGVSYTPSLDEAIEAVDRGRAEAALLVRPPRIEQVFAAARAGKVMPQKTTYFYPKLVSGLLFLPL